MPCRASVAKEQIARPTHLTDPVLPRNPPTGGGFTGLFAPILLDLALSIIALDKSARC
jgi:hypothetical protein